MGMSLKEAFESLPSRGPRCRACLTIAEMPEEDAGFLRKMLADKSVSVRMIVETCNRAGYTELGTNAIGRHRRGECPGLT